MPFSIPSDRKTLLWRPALAALLVLTFSACDSQESPAPLPDEPVATPITAPPSEPLSKPAPAARPSFVTTAVCAECHEKQASAWTGSHHDLAMQPADTTTILGNFDDTTFIHHDVRWRFYRRDERYFVTTEDRNGEQTEFEVLYTFGAEPLQQYLVSLRDGRLQALSAAWDTRSTEADGGRWFSLHGEERIPPGDVLHWTGPSQQWNTMCADCHSTDYKKGYDPNSRSYDSTWSDIDVGCETCHGAGSDHVAWARSQHHQRNQQDERDERDENDDPSLGLTRDLSSVRSAWQLTGSASIASSDGSGVRGAELETCAPCHSRRSSIGYTGTNDDFLDLYRPALLERGLYHDDGQILDEVYVWGSFLQSRMHGAGVTCSDCHDPHSLRLRAQGDALCSSCHKPARYAQTNHHHHEVDNDGARCVSCHMPETTYMQIDGRRDHSFRVPRPDLSVRIGVPNACTGCHTDRSADWAARQVADWPNARQVGLPHFGDAFALARSGSPLAAPRLASIVGNSEFPAIVRATALVELSTLDPERTRTAVENHIANEEPLLRYAAARAGYGLPGNVRASLLLPLVNDPVALVRAEAGRTLAGLEYAFLTEADQADIQAAIKIYADGERARRDEPSASVNLGLLHVALGEIDEAEAAYRDAIAVGPYFLPAYINLADLYRQTGRDEEGRQLLESALERAPDNPQAHHALGLHHIRSKKTDEAVAALKRAAELAPEDARFTYVYAVALDSIGRTDDALRVLRNGLNYSADNLTLLQALVSINVKAGRQDDARRYMDRLRAVARPAGQP
jgi:tetratricopeptide (TPR) repeat protein